jgi:threonine dehydratase
VVQWQRCLLPLPVDKLITVSPGNHGIGAAYGARSFERHVTVVLPQNVKAAKLAGVRVKDILHGAKTGLAKQHA